MFEARRLLRENVLDRVGMGSRDFVKLSVVDGGQRLRFQIARALSCETS